MARKTYDQLTEKQKILVDALQPFVGVRTYVYGFPSSVVYFCKTIEWIGAYSDEEERITVQFRRSCAFSISTTHDWTILRVNESKVRLERVVANYRFGKPETFGYSFEID